MKSFLGLLCFLLLTQGAGGLVYELTDGWFRLWALTHRIGFLDGYQVYVDISLILLGLAVGAAGDRVKESAA